MRRTLISLFCRNPLPRQLGHRLILHWQSYVIWLEWHLQLLQPGKDRLVNYSLLPRPRRLTRLLQLGKASLVNYRLLPLPRRLLLQRKAHPLNYRLFPLPRQLLQPGKDRLESYPLLPYHEDSSSFFSQGKPVTSTIVRYSYHDAC